METFLIKEKVKIFHDILLKYETNFCDLKFISYSIDEFEKIYVIEDSFIIYIGVEEFYDEETQRSFYFNIYNSNPTGIFNIVFEELTYNNILNLI